MFPVLRMSGSILFWPMISPRSVFAMLQRELTGLYHVVGSERITKFEFARRVAATFGFDPARITPCQVKDMNLKAERPLDVSLNTEKISRALGGRCPMSIRVSAPFEHCANGNTRNSSRIIWTIGGSRDDHLEVGKQVGGPGAPYLFRCGHFGQP